MGPLLLDEPHSAIDMDRAANERDGGPDGVGCRDVVVAVGVCELHGETVAEASEWGQWGRVRVVCRGWGEGAAE